MGLGIKVAVEMGKRVEQLREIERIMNYLEGEITYRHSLLAEACLRASDRTKEPFCNWLSIIAEKTENQTEEIFDEEFTDEENGTTSFSDIWEDSIDYLQNESCLTKKDIKELLAFGQALGYLDINTQQMGMHLEKEQLHTRIQRLSEELTNKMKISVILGTLGGIFIVVMLI